MQMPTKITFEMWSADSAIAYVTYGKDDPAARTKEFSESVNADFNQRGELVGIEIVAVTPETLADAARFAAELGAAFPRDLAGCYTLGAPAAATVPA